MQAQGFGSLTEGETVIALQNPELLASLFAAPALEVPAAEATQRLRAALAAIGREI